METFLANHQDYISLIRGIACIYLGMICVELDRRPPLRSTFAWLGLFGFLHGMRDWLEILSVSVIETQVVTVLRDGLSLAFLVALAVFGCRSRGERKGRLTCYAVIFTACALALLHLSPDVATAARLAMAAAFSLLALTASLRAGRLVPVKSRWLLLASVSVGMTVFVSLLLETPARADVTWLPEPGKGCLFLAIRSGILDGVLSAVACVSFWRFSAALPRGQHEQTEGRSIQDGFLGATVLIILAGGWLGTDMAQVEADRRERNGLLQEARVAARAVNAQRIGNLRGDASDIVSHDYVRLKGQLESIREAVPYFRFAYLLAERGDTIVFLVDSEPDASPDFSPPGQVYEEASPSLRRVFKERGEIVEGPVSDSWGTWISALVTLPEVGDTHPRVLLGIDVDATRWNDMIRLRSLPPILITALLAMMAVLFHVARRRHVEIQGMLRNSEMTLRRVFDHVDDAVIVHDETGRIIDVNDRMLELYRLDRSELSSLTVVHQLSGGGNAEDQLPVTWEKVFRGERQTFEWNARRPHDGSEFPAEIHLCRMDLRDRPVVVATVRDLTHQKSTEAALIHSERLAAVGQLSAGVAHEFNNILTVIRSYAQLLLSRSNAEPFHEPLTVIERQTRRAAEIVKSMLTLSRPLPIRQENCAVTELVDAVLRVQWQQLTNENIEIDWRPSKECVRADAGQIQQVLLNLILNARHAMKPHHGGLLTITDRREGDEVVIIVQDTGIGMDEETLNKVFTPFFTTKGGMAKDALGIQGVGLGLSVCYRILQAHEGRIHLASFPGKGTTVEIRLPGGAAVPPASSSPAVPPSHAEAEPVDKNRGRVLIVDDESDIGIPLRDFLASRGYDVVFASTVGDAVEILDRQPFDVLLCDVNMPGPGGLYVTRHAAVRQPGARLILMTGVLDMDRVMREAASLGSCQLLAKPFDLDTAERLVRETVDRRSGA